MANTNLYFWKQWWSKMFVWNVLRNLLFKFMFTAVHCSAKKVKLASLILNSKFLFVFIIYIVLCLFRLTAKHFQQKSVKWFEVFISVELTKWCVHCYRCCVVVTVSETDKTKPVYYQLFHRPLNNKTQDSNYWYQLNSKPWLKGLSFNTR